MVSMEVGGNTFRLGEPNNMGEAEPINTSVEGIEVGSYFPNIAKTMDDVCVVRSVTTREMP